MTHFISSIFFFPDVEGRSRDLRFAELEVLDNVDLDDLVWVVDFVNFGLESDLVDTLCTVFGGFSTIVSSSLSENSSCNN